MIMMTLMMMIIIIVMIIAIMITMIKTILIIAIVIINGQFQPGDFSTGSTTGLLILSYLQLTNELIERKIS